MGRIERLPAVIFDIDNTILYHTNRSPFDWSDLSGDKLIKEMYDLMLMYYKNDYKIILLTGRPESVRLNTEKWLINNNVPYDMLLMKQNDPYEKGFISKQKELDKLKQCFDVKFAYDDDTKCAEMFKDNGIITFQPINYKFR